MLLQSRLEKNFPSCNGSMTNTITGWIQWKCCRPGFLQGYKSQWIHRTLLENGEQERGGECDRPSSLGLLHTDGGRFSAVRSQHRWKTWEALLEEHSRIAFPKKCKPQTQPTFRRGQECGKWGSTTPGNAGARKDSLSLSLPSTDSPEHYLLNQVKSRTTQHQTPSYKKEIPTEFEGVMQKRRGGEYPFLFDFMLIMTGELASPLTHPSIWMVSCPSWLTHLLLPSTLLPESLSGSVLWSTAVENCTLGVTVARQGPADASGLCEACLVVDLENSRLGVRNEKHPARSEARGCEDKCCLESPLQTEGYFFSFLFLSRAACWFIHSFIHSSHIH